MKMAPAVAAAAPAALVRPLVVTFISGSWFRVPDRLSGDAQDARRQTGDPTSHDDVTDPVTDPPIGVPPPRLEQVELGGASDRCPPRRDVELGEDVTGVGTERVDRHEQLPRDLWAGQGRREHAGHIDIEFA